MSTAPEDLWTMLPVTLRRQIVDDIAVVLAEVFRDVRVDPTGASEAQGRRLHSAIDGVYDPSGANGRLLLGLKGTISELELHTIRSRLTTGLIAKAQRGELALTLPVGLVRDACGVVLKDPDIGVQDRLGLVFELFLKLRSIAATPLFWINPEVYLWHI